jgi:hypothetical protein
MNIHSDSLVQGLSRALSQSTEISSEFRANFGTIIPRTAARAWLRRPFLVFVA